MKFYPLKIKSKEALTPEAVAISFEVPSELKSLFQFRAGQYLTLKSASLGDDLRRSYSICASEAQDTLRIGVKKVENGKFSNLLHNNSNLNGEIEVSLPMGKFTLPEGSYDKNLLMIAAGSGITPILSHIETALEASSTSNVTLIYGNKTPQSTMFRDRLDQLKNLYLERLNVIHVFSAISQEMELFSGRVTADRVQGILERWLAGVAFDHVFICGPEPMTMEVRDRLLQLGFDQSSVHYELFGTFPVHNDQAKKNAGPKISSASESIELTVILDGISHDIKMRNGEHVLQAARRHNLDAPFSCKGGICSTCRCKIIEGAAQMEVNHALEDYEVQEGYALSCQLRPESKRLVISYDEGH